MGLRTAIACLMLLLPLLLVFPATAEVLIVNSSVNIHSLSRKTARAIFSMRLRSWEDGTPITVFVLSDRDPVHRRFVQSVLGMFPHQLRRSWDRYRYTGIGQAPIQVANEAEMLSRVNGTPGAIGYLQQTEALVASPTDNTVNNSPPPHNSNLEKENPDGQIRMLQVL